MNDDNVTPIAAVCFLLGMIVMGAVTSFVNRDITDIVKASEICESLNSKPAYYDTTSELVCENGASVNYRSFDKEK